MDSIATRQMGRIIDERLDNGLRVVIEPMRDVSSAAAGFMARAGSRDEPAEWAGISHFLEHMCFKGTRKCPWRQITIDFDDMGAYYNAFTSREHTFYFGWVRRADIDKQIELLSDLVRPILPQDEFDMEKKVVLEEIAMSDDDLDRHLYELLHEKVFAGHGLRWPVLGYKETVGGLTRQNMLDYHAEHYSPSNMVLIVAGNVEPEAVLRTAAGVTADWANVGKVPPRQVPAQLQTGTAVRVMDRFKQQCVAYAMPTGAAGAGEERIEAIAAVLGGENSRFFWNIIQKGISPQAGVWGVTYADCGFQLLYAFGEPEKAEQMTEAIRREAETLQKDGIKPEELQRFKNRRRTGLAVDGEAAYNRLMQMMQDIDYHDHARTLDERLGEVEAVTVESLHEHLRRYPVAGEGYFVSVGPREWPSCRNPKECEEPLRHGGNCGRRDMSSRDDVAAANEVLWQGLVHGGCDYTAPWLDLDVQVLRRYAAGQLDPVPERLAQMHPVSVLADVAGKDVLCLASGGGQQSAVFALLGAKVTVVDLAEGQLEGDRRAASHYGYAVRTIHGDMRDLSALAAGAFDLVFQAPSMAYVPDVRPVYAGVARVLRPGGRYRVQLSNPATEFVDWEDWDGQGYRISRRYAERMRRRSDGGMEFRHPMRDIFNGLIEVGLAVEQVEENPEHLPQDPHAQPGTWAHWLTYVTGFVIVARKQ